jgi:serine phosphatase RsbU (regulator of sigma subunit)
VTLLNESVSHEKILSPDLILESLREKLIVALGQKDYSDKIKDGIEGSVFIFDTTTNYYSVSGSGNPIVQIHNGALIEIKPQRIPIGLSEKKTNFVNVPLNVSKNDMLYLFSDGYIDQFGGPLSKRFMIKKLKAVLSGIHHLSTEEQKARLLAEILLWRGDSEQTDDILILGIRL